jgi:hypothetical protein
MYASTRGFFFPWLTHLFAKAPSFAKPFRQSQRAEILRAQIEKPSGVAREQLLFLF